MKRDGARGIGEKEGNRGRERETIKQERLERERNETRSAVKGEGGRVGERVSSTRQRGSERAREEVIGEQRRRIKS